MVDSEDLDETMYNAVIALGLTWPGFALRFKDEKPLMRLLGKSLFWNRHWSTGYVTTFGSVVYFPSRVWLKAVGFKHAWKILAHELVHVADERRLGGMFGILYGAPQVFALLALGAFWSPWFLLALACLAPIPSPGRKRLEMRGYAMSMAVDYWQYGVVKQEQKDRIAAQFIGPDYYFCWPFRKAVYLEIEVWLDKIASGAVLDQEPVFRQVHDLMRLRGVADA